MKPEFFRHEELYEAERNAALPLRLAFIGLWTCCDKNGVFPWRPRALKLDVLPYDDVDFTAVLTALEGAGFVMQFEHDGALYGFVPTFTEHQRFTGKEAQSDGLYPLPDGVKPPGSNGEAPEKPPGTQEQGTGNKEQGTGKGEAREAPPAGLDADAWTLWTDYRSKIRKPLKPVSIPAAQQALAAFGSDQDAVVKQSIANGWQGLFALKHNGHDHAKPATSRFDKLRGQR